MSSLDFAATDRASVEATFRSLDEAIAGNEVTVAVGASLFDGRFGFQALRPRRLGTMPAFPNDVLDARQCHGDILVQVCAAESGEAERVSQRLAGATSRWLRPRWSIGGFRDENSATKDGRPSTRDLFGFREGAGNPDVNDPKLMDQLVWVQPASDEPAWTAGGTYQVVRLIRFAPSLWDAESVARQETVIGRTKRDGSPLGRLGETTPFDYSSDPSGETIALDAHIRRANPRRPETDQNRILRRGYSYRRNAENPRDEGLIFICFQQDLERGFAAVQRRLNGQALDKYILPFGGGYYFVLPGPTHRPGDYAGKALIDAAHA
ncbi:Dyp-type peroxidase [Amycolatopsis sp. NPDC004079]|uniref:Dyp-type peroxidase n=1 Tax=Amycolatopsis sp. NPDC004079 TaxID=3154549 RepID=UPI0033BAE64B